MSGGMHGAGDPVPPAHDLAGGGRPEDGDVASSAGRGRARDDAARLAARAGDGGRDALRTWLDDAAAAEAGASRARVASLDAQATADATLAGVLVSLAERRSTVVVTTVDGTTHVGTVDGVGADVVALDALDAPAGPVLLALGAVATVRVHPAGGRVADTRSVRGDVRLADLLAEFAAERERVALRLRGAGVLRGRLRRANAHVCELHLDGRGADGAQVVVVAVDAVTEVVPLER